MSVSKDRDKKARIKLVWYKLSGVGCGKIDDEDIAFLEGVKDKDKKAMWLLGLCYEYGMGCQQDLEKAHSLFEQAQALDGGRVVSILEGERDRRQIRVKSAGGGLLHLINHLEKGREQS